jgi:hypothetical protein
MTNTEVDRNHRVEHAAAVAEQPSGHGHSDAHEQEGHRGEWLRVGLVTIVIGVT